MVGEFLRRENELLKINILEPQQKEENHQGHFSVPKKMRKFSSSTLFKEARKTNGETYLKTTPENTLISMKSKNQVR